jgi:hypothetical protein
MKPPRPAKRSVSPFGLMEAPVDAVTDLTDLYLRVLGQPEGKPPARLSAGADAVYLPAMFRRIWDAPANDAPELDDVIQFLVQHRPYLEEKSLHAPTYDFMRRLFELKTDMFLIDHHDREHCEKVGWAGDHRDIVLFSRERDALVGRYFAVITEREPGLLSEFIHSWVESDRPDALLHFLDFTAGSANPTFEHYLLFAHPALHRVVGNKALLRGLFDQTKSVLARLSSPTWEKDVRAALSI